MTQVESPVFASAQSRCTAGCPGLDDILVGGFPRRVFLFAEGESGTGKTTLAPQFTAEDESTTTDTDSPNE
jgi:RecA/RadA recombinase